MNPNAGFAETIQEDLRQCSPMLLEAGLTGMDGLGQPAGAGPLGALVLQARTFGSLVPRLLVDYEEQSLHGSEVASVVVPRRGRLSRSARDYLSRGGEIYPARFRVVRSTVEKDPAVLSWLLHLSYLLEDKLERATGRLRKHVRGELEGRRDYTWALRKENDLLRAMEASLSGASACMTRVQRRILEQGEFRLRPQPDPPGSCPSSPVFASLRALSYELTASETALSRELRGAVSQQATASLPFLYQRWCGVKIVDELREMGWIPFADPLPALFLGGRIRFSKDTPESPQPVAMTLWCEPHLTLQGRHPSRLYSLHKEASPDFVFITPGPHGQDAFVLDPTLSTDATARREKSRYLTDLAFDNLQLVAGVPALHHPRRAWSISPVRTKRCEPLDLEGRSGTIPLSPIEYDAEALSGWLEDVESHAISWASHAVPKPETPDFP